jgi:hypothetical protein
MEDEGLCERCGEPVEAINVEAFEVSGQVVCEDCADEVFAS